MHKKKTLYTFSGKWDKQLTGKDLRDKVIPAFLSLWIGLHCLERRDVLGSLW